MEARDTPAVIGVFVHTRHLSVRRKGRVAELRKGDGTGGLVIRLRDVRHCSPTDLQCGRRCVSISLADRSANLGDILRNSYVMAHGSFPRRERLSSDRARGWHREPFCITS